MIRKLKIGDKVIDSDCNIGIVLTLPGYDIVPDDSVGVNFKTGYFIVMKKHLKHITD